MEDKEFKAQYKKEFDNIHASDELKNAVKNLNPKRTRRGVTPFKATIGTVAAAIMIFAAVHEYNFNTDTSGVISETVVSTHMPEAQFEIVEKGKTDMVPDNGEDKATTTQKPKPADEPTATAESVPQLIPAPVTTQMPAQYFTPAPVSEPDVKTANEDAGIMPMDEDGPSPRSLGGEAYALPRVRMWTVEQYYEYLGVNVSNKITGKYTGAQSFEFEVGSDGVPLDDTAVLNFLTNSGASVRVNVSKHVLFDASLSGTVTEAGGGYNAYKVSNGVYYNIYVTNTTQDEVVSIVNSL